MLSIVDVEARLSKLRENAISLADFDHWVVSVGWNLQQKAPRGSRVYELIREIQGCFSEYEHGEYDESELREALLSLLPSDSIVLSAPVGIDPVLVARAFPRLANSQPWFQPALRPVAA